MLTGWAVGSKPLIPLAKQLQQLGYQVTLVDLPYKIEAQQWLIELAKQLPRHSIWLGWSLGGQLLSYLTSEYGQFCKGLVTLAANPCFKARHAWLCAMASDIFANFQIAYQQNSTATLKRFLQLVTYGCSDARLLLKQLQQSLEVHPLPEANAGLTLLAEIDARSSLKEYPGKQLHLFAEQDALVPANCAYELAQLIGESKIRLLTNTGHAFPMQNILQTSQLLDDFIKKCYE